MVQQAALTSTQVTVRNWETNAKSLIDTNLHCGILSSTIPMDIDDDSDIQQNEDLDNSYKSEDSCSNNNSEDKEEENDKNPKSSAPVPVMTRQNDLANHNPFGVSIQFTSISLSNVPEHS